ncbi:hypothetical protein B5M47_03240 [candidate division CPR3 bacterium 4484_211]|uniref:Uncharacterized protein n=1 Tax=candidate division CPR3 bacterium 4484_211 TaxID=1968527 RepID=A0A1W9NXH2_UNCC3|nr:MAG: hypothetical protein B5M47_03240 [candidate division CPR3 bacterium 4484_211]
MTHEKISFPKPELDASTINAFTEASNRISALREKLTRPYTQLEIESSARVQVLINEALKSLEPASRIYREADQSPSLRNELRKKAPISAYFAADGLIKHSLLEYRESVGRLEQLGEILLQHPLFKSVADKLVKHGPVYVSGGLTATATQSIGTHRKGLNLQTDIDVIVDCDTVKLPAIAEELKQALPKEKELGVEATYHAGPIPRIGIVSQTTGLELISIVSPQPFAEIIKQTSAVTRRQVFGDSNIAKMLIHWPENTVEQIAIRFNPDLSFDIVNGGKPLLRSNRLTRNEHAWANWQTIRQLNDLGREDLGRLLLGSAIKGLSRTPKMVEKGIGALEPELTESSGQELSTPQVALGEFLKMDRSPEKGSQEFISSIRRDAAVNFIKAILTGDRRLWQDLPFTPFEGLFSETLCQERGFQLVRGEGIGESFVASPSSWPEWEKVTALVTLTTGPAPTKTGLSLYYEKLTRPSICQSPTEYFAVLAGIALADDTKLQKIAAELANNWPLKESNRPKIFPRWLRAPEGYEPKEMNCPWDFNQELFLEWAQQIRGAIQKSGVSLSEIADLEQTPEGKWGVKLYEKDSDEERAHEERIGRVLTEIKSTPFWKQRNMLAQ